MLINQRCAFGANGKAIVVPTFGIFRLEPNCRGFSEKLQIAFPFNTKKTGKISEKEFFADFGNFSFLNDFEPTRKTNSDRTNTKECTKYPYASNETDHIAK